MPNVDLKHYMMKAACLWDRQRACNKESGNCHHVWNTSISCLFLLECVDDVTKTVTLQREGVSSLYVLCGSVGQLNWWGLLILLDVVNWGQTGSIVRPVIDEWNGRAWYKLIVSYLRWVPWGQTGEID